MSAESLQAIEDAVVAHLRESAPEVVTVDFVLCWGAARFDDDEQGDGIEYQTGYVASASVTPWGTHGLIAMAQSDLIDDMTPGEDETNV